MKIMVNPKTIVIGVVAGSSPWVVAGMICKSELAAAVLLTALTIFISVVGMMIYESDV